MLQRVPGPPLSLRNCAAEGTSANLALDQVLPSPSVDFQSFVQERVLRLFEQEILIVVNLVVSFRIDVNEFGAS